MAMYCLMFKDPGLRKLTSSNMEIETYTNDVVKIIGTCNFYLVHPESEQLIKVCCERKWKHLTVMQNYYGTRTDQAKCTT